MRKLIFMEADPIQYPRVQSSPGQFRALPGPTSTIETVHFLELVENIKHVKNYVDPISFDMISKCNNLCLIVLHGL